VSRLVTSRAQINAEYDFVIETEGRFLGIGTVINLLRKITQLRVRPDHQENLLTMLPGNTPISTCVDELLEKNATFSVALLDLSNFKVFNNYYGHLAGDQVLIMFAELLRRHVLNTENFIGHIGGDDFILVIKGLEWQKIVASIFEEFNHKVLKFYSEQDVQQGGIQVTQLDADAVIEPLISLTAGVMTIHDEYVESFKQVMANLIKLKPLTKKAEEIRVVNQRQKNIKRYQYKEGNFSEEAI
jgi:diguanylate cyclase (GGDEF)-like protein